MRVTTRRSSAAGVLVLSLLVAGCTAGTDTGEPDVSTSPTSPVQPTDDGPPIEPLDQIQGARREVVEGVGFDVPEGMVVTPREDPIQSQLFIGAPGVTPSAVMITISVAGDGAVNDEETIDASSLLFERELLGTGQWGDPTRYPVEWDGMGYAVASHMTSTVESGEEVEEVLFVTVLDEEGNRVIGVSARGPEGELEDSVAYQILRTVRLGE